MFTFPSNLPETRGAPPLSSFKAASRTSAVPPPTPTQVLSLLCRCWGTVSRARLHNEISRLKRAAGDTKRSLCPAVLGHLHPDLGPHGCCRNRTSRILPWMAARNNIKVLHWHSFQQDPCNSPNCTFAMDKKKNR